MDKIKFLFGVPTETCVAANDGKGEFFPRDYHVAIHKRVIPCDDSVNIVIADDYDGQMQTR